MDNYFLNRGNNCFKNLFWKYLDSDKGLRMTPEVVFLNDN